MSETQQVLLRALTKAHSESSFRDNASSVAVINAAAGSGDVGKAIIAGILTLGGKHAPLEETYNFLNVPDPSRHVDPWLESGWKIPGWGGTFQKDQPDPIWEPVNRILHDCFPELFYKIDSVTVELHKFGKRIHPNPSAYTAATAIALELPAELAIYLFISARLRAWCQLAYNAIAPKNF